MLWSAFLFGLFGSFHCVGMCGAIALSIPMNISTRIALVKDTLFYNLGRVIMYSIIGLFAGAFGRTFVELGYQQWLSLTVGILIILAFIMPSKIQDKTANLLGLTFLHKKFRKLFGKFIAKPSSANLLITGLLNGMLPCGFVYIALAGAVLTGNLLDSAMYMAIFGLGTIPMMVLTTLSGNLVTIQFRNKIKKLKPYLAICVALLFIIRGLALGIPYLSPKIPSSHQTEEVCGTH
jgi:sulfite exporter TauE/SafE